jgi:hypothetical protein
MNEGHIRKGEVEPLAIAISDIAIRNLPAPNSSSREAYEWTNRAYFPEIVNSVAVHRLDAITETHFTSPGATWVAPFTAADIERALVSKEPKHSTYRQRCDEAWLLINADISAMSTWFQFDPAAVSGTLETRFERVFVLRHFGSTLHEIAVVPPRTEA